MDRRVWERRRLVNRDRGRRRAGLIFLCALAVLAVVLFLWLRSTSVFAVEEISAPSTHHVTQEQIANAVASARGVNLLKLSTGRIARNLEALPYVRRVQVYRKFPHGLELRIEEYEPVVRIRGLGGKTWLVADDGRVLDRASADAEDSALPLIVADSGFVAQTGRTVPQLVLEALPAALMLQSASAASTLPAAKELTVSAGGEVVVLLEGGTELRLGSPTDLKQKITVSAEIIQENLRDGKTLEYVDTSAPGRVAVKAN